MTWEVAIKQSAGKLTVDPGYVDRLVSGGVRVLPITIEHARAVAGLPFHHRDPFDRLLVSQAQVEGAAIVSAAPIFAAYGVPVVW